MEAHAGDGMPHKFGVHPLNEAEFLLFAEVIGNVRVKGVEELPGDQVVLLVHPETTAYDQEDLLRVGIHIIEERDIGRLPLQDTLAHVTGVRIGTMKIAFDVTLVGIGAVISLAMFGRIEGIREGTLVAMFLVGLIVGRILPPLTRWFSGIMHQEPGDTPPEIAPDMSA